MAAKGTHLSDEHKRKLAEKAREYWSDPDKKARRTEAIRSGWARRKEQMPEKCSKCGHMLRCTCCSGTEGETVDEMQSVGDSTAEARQAIQDAWAQYEVAEQLGASVTSMVAQLRAHTQRDDDQMQDE